MNIKIAIAGCCGRMGRSIASLALADKNFEIIGATDMRSHPDIGTSLGKIIGNEALDIKIQDDLSVAAKGADVIIDFTAPIATLLNLRLLETKRSQLL